MKRVAITQRVVERTEYRDVLDSLSLDWQVWLTKMLPDSVLVALPNEPSLVEPWWFERKPQILILSGGNNWGESRIRDETETCVVALARASGVPILGVCRGLQALNVIFGGQIEQNLDSVTAVQHIGTTHSVSIVTDLMKAALGRETIEVNSYHSQGVVLSELAKEFTAFAVSDETVVEGIYHMREPILATQWHPERLGPNNELDSVLFQQLLDATFLKHGGR